MEEAHVIFLLVALALAPGLFWLLYFYEKDRLEPEPLHLVRNSFLWGMVVTVPAAVFERVFHFSGEFTVVIAAPIIEEGLKFLAVVLTIYGHPEFDEPMDGVIYAVAVALGFASVENVFYLYSAYQGVDGALQSVSALRAVFSVPAHAAFAIMWGYALGVAKFSPVREGRRLVIVGLLLGMCVHALFNLVCLLPVFWEVGMLVLIPAIWKAAGRRIGHAAGLSPHRTAADPAVEDEPVGATELLGEERMPWFESRGLMILLLLIQLAPIAVFGLVKNRTWPLPEKVAYVALWIIMYGSITVALLKHVKLLE